MSRVMLVDDDEDLLDAVEMWLARDHQVTVARGVPEALALLERGPVPDVVITDYEMGAHSGDELLAVVALRYPRVCRILHTGTPHHERASAEALADHVVEKGTSLNWLSHTVRECERGRLSA